MSSEKLAVITGCGKGGIGHALTKQLRKKGFAVIATLLPHESEEHLLDVGAEVFRLDVTSDKGVQEFESFLKNRGGGNLDVLVNNAGICYTMPAADTEVREVEKMFAVNLFGPMRLVHHLHPMLIRSKGVIVNIGSIGGIIPFTWGASYNASKAALHHYGNTLRVEMLPFNVRVVNIISGVTASVGTDRFYGSTNRSILGEVSTNILKSDVNRALPSDSVYASVAEAFRSHVQRTPKAMSADEYASGVVNEMLRRSPAAWFWHGASSTSVRICDALLPRTFWDWWLWREFDLGKVKASV